jgi:hypothetical protein
LPRLCSHALSYRCAVKVAHSDSGRAVEVTHSVHCRAFEVTHSVYHHAVEAERSVYCRAVEVCFRRAVTLRSQLILSPLQLHSQVYCHAVKVACSVDCHAPTFIIAPIAQLSSLSRPSSRVHLNHHAVMLIVAPVA